MGVVFFVPGVLSMSQQIRIPMWRDSYLHPACESSVRYHRSLHAYRITHKTPAVTRSLGYSAALGFWLSLVLTATLRWSLSDITAGWYAGALIGIGGVLFISDVFSPRPVRQMAACLLIYFVSVTLGILSGVVLGAPLLEAILSYF